MTGERRPFYGEPSPERNPNERLLRYLQSKVSGALAYEDKESEHDQEELNGTLWQYLGQEATPSFLRNTLRVLMKRPHPHDKPGEFVEVYSMLVDEGTAWERIKSAPTASYFFIRKFTNGEPGDFWVSGPDGLTTLGLDQDLGPKQLQMLVDNHEEQVLRDFILRSNPVAVTVEDY